jgi:crotonobetainyl-CoA:carnitine CoA-transferase CaiB-like acyl-CoA transferase
VSTSLVHGAMAFMMRQELGRGSADAPATTIAPAAKRGIELCFLTAECADGRYIQMCARQDKHFRDWLAAVGLDDVLREPRYAAAPMGIATVADVDELEVRLRERMRTKTQAEWMRVFVEDFDVGADPFLTPTEFLSHPDMVANGRVVDIADPLHGTVRELGPLVQMAATPARIERSPLVESPGTVAWQDERMSLRPPDAAGDRVPPLRGVTIVEVAYYVAGPLATAILAEMGARVIKVEPLDGDPYRRTGLQSAKFLHGKESLTLDLKQSRGRAILDTLIDGADVVVHSFRTAAARKLGLDPVTVHERNPGAVHLYAASYGSLGPQRDRAAFHSTPNALTGGGIKQAGRGNPPVNDSYADPGSALGAATAIMFGLWAKTRTGAGQALETTMLASTGYIHSADMVGFDSAPEWRIADGRQRGLSSRYRLYRCSTGYIFLAAIQEREWAALLDVIERPDLAEWVLDDDALAVELERVFVSRASGDWVSALGATGVGIAEVFAGEFDRWLEEHDRLIPMDHPAFGPYWRLEPKIDLSRSSPQLRPACALGEQSCDLLGELGFDQPAIDEMIAAAVTTDGRIKAR